ncbi:hypothetical protein ACFV0D_39535 [Streptomyces sp. NPDC059556]|uniref:hypothetical protein n=1 Tax=Streptomyces sp. NPDC059556 TaxID=3346863 RepID=UPI003676AACB
MSRPVESSDDLLRATVVAIARRTVADPRSAGALGSVLELIGNDEAELALDHLSRSVEYYRIPVLREEYDRLVAEAARLDSKDSLSETGLERFVIG